MSNVNYHAHFVVVVLDILPKAKQKLLVAVWILGTPSNLCRPEYGFPFLDLANWPGYMAMMAMSGCEPIFNADKDRLRVATFFPWRIFFQKIAKFSCMNMCISLINVFGSNSYINVVLA